MELLGIILLTVLGLVVVYATASIRVVHQTERGVVFRLGRVREAPGSRG